MTPSPALREHTANLWFKKLTAYDLTEEIADGAEELLAAVNTRMPELVGKVVLAIVDAYCVRLADGELGTTTRKIVLADDAARLVLLQASVERAEVNRKCGMEIVA